MIFVVHEVSQSFIIHKLLLQIVFHCSLVQFSSAQQVARAFGE